MEIFEIIQSGIYSSIQDAGRFGQRSCAIPQSGCLDRRSQYLANYLVGNSPDTAVIELIGGRFQCLVLEETHLGIVGALREVTVNGEAQSNNETIRLQVNDLLKIEGCGLVYLAISGGVNARLHFGSVSAYPLAKLGGLNGDVLKKGNRVSTTSLVTPLVRHLPEQVLPKYSTHQVIRILKGKEWDILDMETSGFEEKNWIVSFQSNRMGFRMEGTPLETRHGEMNPVPTFPGTIQLTNEGLPIVLMNDAQTTGGYPRIGQVIKADLSRLARLILDGTIKFKFVDISEARYILNQNETFLRHALN